MGSLNEDVLVLLYPECINKIAYRVFSTIA